jgi:hypothetical protein
MLAIVCGGTAWLISGYAGAVLIDTREPGPLKFIDVAMGPISLALGIMVATDRKPYPAREPE